ncbi:hypothetical protein LA76x_2431 [Lysobacter antibioticus]|uniref:Uncharacterized protein n=1 Tax=Lysobacter antibioticus TaxID=84531 RepID=A0A0S2FAK2_LYSAN|nr:hypothetical protein LA76x_2431 [Lysobacter antibioticus]
MRRFVSRPRRKPCNETLENKELSFPARLLTRPRGSCSIAEFAASATDSA